MEEHRREKRIPFRVAVQFLPMEPKDSSIDPGQVQGGGISKDLSKGGMKLYFNNFVPLKTRLVLNFPVNPETKVAMKGQVVWVQKVPHGEKYQVGVKFSKNESDMESRNALDDLFNPN